MPREKGGRGQRSIEGEYKVTKMKAAVKVYRNGDPAMAMAMSLIKHVLKRVRISLEMSCPWVTNQEKKEEEKATKYGSLRWELKQKYQGYEVKQYKIIKEVSGGWCRDLEVELKELVGIKSKGALHNMQKAVIPVTLNISRTFKVAT